MNINIYISQNKIKNQFVGKYKLVHQYQYQHKAKSKYRFSLLSIKSLQQHLHHLNI